MYIYVYICLYIYIYNIHFGNLEKKIEPGLLYHCRHWEELPSEMYAITITDLAFLSVLRGGNWAVYG